MNQAWLTGNLTRDPDVRFTRTGIAVARFSLACTETFRKQDGSAGQFTDYPNITAWGKWAEYAGNNLHKGDQCSVIGRIQTGSYEKDGRKVYTTEVNVSMISAPAVKRNQPAAQPGQSFNGMGSPANNDEEIPF